MRLIYSYRDLPWSDDDLVAVLKHVYEAVATGFPTAQSVDVMVHDPIGRRISFTVRPYGYSPLRYIYEVTADQTGPLKFVCPDDPGGAFYINRLIRSDDERYGDPEDERHVSWRRCIDCAGLLRINVAGALEAALAPLVPGDVQLTYDIDAGHIGVTVGDYDFDCRYKPNEHPDEPAYDTCFAFVSLDVGTPCGDARPAGFAIQGSDLKGTYP